jgi:DNA end-binding protein Ku
MRAMWKGTISFGLVNIPVSMYKATEEHKTSFRSLHNECHQPIQYKKWCPACHREVQHQEIIRGYEYAPGNFITLTDEEMDKLPLPTLRTIEILHFTDKDNIDPIYYENAYYLGPSEFGVRPYRLLHTAMNQTGQVAVAKIAFRTSEHLSVLRLHRNCLVLNFIHYPAEIRAVHEVPGLEGAAPVTEAELQMAVQLIEQISGAFRHDYRSNYEAALQQLIQAKLQNVEIEQPRAIPVVDLMEALTRSLAAVGRPAAIVPDPGPSAGFPGAIAPGAVPAAGTGAPPTAPSPAAAAPGVSAGAPFPTAAAPGLSPATPFPRVVAPGLPPAAPFPASAASGTTPGPSFPPASPGTPAANFPATAVPGAAPTPVFPAAADPGSLPASIFPPTPASSGATTAAAVPAARPRRRR